MTRKSLSEVAELNIRAIVDEITLQVADEQASEDDLSSQICDKAMEHITRIQDETPLSEKELDRIARVIIRGVLIRLNQIAESGGRIGSA